MVELRACEKDNFLMFPYLGNFVLKEELEPEKMLFGNEALVTLANIWLEYKSSQNTF